MWFWISLLVSIVVYFVVKGVIVNKKNTKSKNLIEKLRADAQYDLISEYIPQDTSSKVYVESKECEEVLNALINADIQSANYKLKKLLIINPNNELAKTINLCEFHLDSYIGGDIRLLTFDFLPIEIYLANNMKQLDPELLLTFMELLANKYDSEENSLNCFILCLDQMKYSVKTKSEYLTLIYKFAFILSNSKYSEQIRKLLGKTKNSGLKTFLWTNNEYLAAGMDSIRDDIKYYDKLLSTIKNGIVKMMKEYIKLLAFFTEEEKQIIADRIGVIVTGF